MIKGIAERVGGLLLVIWLAATLAFFALRILPGDAVTAQLTQSGADAAAIAEQRARLGLDQPIFVQYARFIAGLLRGDLGESLHNRQPVAEMIATRLRPTMTLALGALVVAATVGLLLGTAAGLVLPYGTSQAARLLIGLSLSVPIYWTGTLALFLLAVPFGGGPDSLDRLLPPVAILGFHTAGAIARVTQASVRETLSAPFIRTAYAKGLTEHHILWYHVLRPGLLPVITVIALQAGFLMSGTVITEVIFVRPGLGQLLVNATLGQDYPVVQGVVVLSAVVYALANMSAEIAYRLLDPRVAAR